MTVSLQHNNQTPIYSNSPTKKQIWQDTLNILFVFPICFSSWRNNRNQIERWKRSDHSCIGLERRFFSHTAIKKNLVFRITGQARVLLSDLSQNQGARFIFSESCRQQRRDSLCGSWLQPPPCSRMGSCVCPSNDEVHRIDSHSGSRTLTKKKKMSISSHDLTNTSRLAGWSKVFLQDRLFRSPVRPTFLRHIKHLFLLGLVASGVLASSLPAVLGDAVDAVGWVTTAKIFTGITHMQIKAYIYISIIQHWRQFGSVEKQLQRLTLIFIRCTLLIFFIRNKSDFLVLRVQQSNRTPGSGSSTFGEAASSSQEMLISVICCVTGRAAPEELLGDSALAAEELFSVASMIWMAEASEVGLPVTPLEPTAKKTTSMLMNHASKKDLMHHSSIERTGGGQFALTYPLS